MNESIVEKTAYTEHLFQFRSLEKRRLALSLIITIIVMLVEIVGGLLTNSIALISEAAHLFTHAFAISISLLAIFIARKPAGHEKTFGLYRAEVLAAFINGLFLLPIVGLMIYEAILRFFQPESIVGLYMLIVAFIGLGVNISSILILQGSQTTNLNVKSVFYHMIADVASSVGIVVAAVIIILTDFVILDPIVSLGISFVILYWSYGILRDSTRILLEMSPKGMNIDIIAKDLKQNFPQILEFHDVHLWTIIPDMIVYSAHITVDYEKVGNNQAEFISKINSFLHKNHNINESTIQILQKDIVSTSKF